MPSDEDYVLKIAGVALRTNSVGIHRMRELRKHRTSIFRFHSQSVPKDSVGHRSFSGDWPSTRLSESQINLRTDFCICCEESIYITCLMQTSTGTVQQITKNSALTENPHPPTTYNAHDHSHLQGVEYEVCWLRRPYREIPKAPVY
jgi:hypothetical protein